MTATDTATLDITDPAFKADPFPRYARMRATAPVVRVTAGRRQGAAWLVPRYADVQELLRDDRFAKKPANAMTREQLRRAPTLPGGPFRPLQEGLLNVDPPQHTRLRALVHKAFTPRMVERMRADVEVLTEELLDAALHKGDVDLITDLANPLPLTVVGRILGVPGEDQVRFQRGWQVLSSAADGRPGGALRAVPAVLGMMRLLRGLVRARASAPRDDLISALVAAREGDDALTEDEILAMIVILLSAGHETTVNLIASGTLALLQHPDQLARLRDDPGLGRTATEELLRFVAPAETATERYPREDLVIGGVRIPRGELVLAGIASANRDEAVFADPDRLDLGRDPNPHLAFGKGIHYCVGAPLARMEGEIAIAALLRRAPHLRLAIPAANLRWRSTSIIRGLTSLPLTLR